MICPRGRLPAVIHSIRFRCFNLIGQQPLRTFPALRRCPVRKLSSLGPFAARNEEYLGTSITGSGKAVVGRRTERTFDLSTAPSFLPGTSKIFRCSTIVACYSSYLWYQSTNTHYGQTDPNIAATGAIQHSPRAPASLSLTLITSIPPKCTHDDLFYD